MILCSLLFLLIRCLYILIPVKSFVKPSSGHAFYILSKFGHSRYYLDKYDKYQDYKSITKYLIHPYTYYCCSHVSLRGVGVDSCHPGEIPRYGRIEKGSWCSVTIRPFIRYRDVSLALRCHISLNRGTYSDSKISAGITENSLVKSDHMNNLDDVFTRSRSEFAGMTLTFYTIIVTAMICITYIY